MDRGFTGASRCQAGFGSNECGGWINSLASLSHSLGHSGAVFVLWQFLSSDTSGGALII